MKPNLYSCQCEEEKENKLQFGVDKEEWHEHTQLLHTLSHFVLPGAAPQGPQSLH